MPYPAYRRFGLRRPDKRSAIRQQSAAMPDGGYRLIRPTHATTLGADGAFEAVKAKASIVVGRWICCNLKPESHTRYSVAASDLKCHPFTGGQRNING
jgi:hypothetical protein